MPQPKSSGSSSRSSASRSTSAASRSTAAKKGAATRKAAANKSAASATARGKKAAATRKANAAKSSPRKSNAKPAAQKAAVDTGEGARVQLTQLREALRKGVVVTTGSLKEAMDDAVKRGQITRKDATALTQNIVATGRQQADGFRAGIEQLLGKGTSRATQTGDVALREVDRARRAVGVGPTFPISLYDNLSAAQVQKRLNDLTPAELRKVRDYEKRNQNRKSVQGAIERKLSK
jgi:polyhydroxyalkanoate synthesis regulator phasin